MCPPHRTGWRWDPVATSLNISPQPPCPPPPSPPFYMTMTMTLCCTHTHTHTHLPPFYMPMTVRCPPPPTDSPTAHSPLKPPSAHMLPHVCHSPAGWLLSMMMVRSRSRGAIRVRLITPETPPTCSGGGRGEGSGFGVGGVGAAHPGGAGVGVCVERVQGSGIGDVMPPFSRMLVRKALGCRG